MKKATILVPFTLSFLIAASAALAQTAATGADDGQKQDKSIRQVGPNGWPAAKTAEQKQNDRRGRTAKSGKIDAGAPKSSSKSSAQADPLALPSMQEAKPDSAQPAPSPAASQRAATSGEVKKDGATGAASIRLGTNAEGRVAVNDVQQRQIGTAVRKLNVRPAAGINFDIRVGTAVPASVRLTAASSEFVSVLPQFRGYSFFSTRGEIVIVEPGSMKIVALIPVAGTATASRPARARTTAPQTTTSNSPRITTRTTTGAAVSEEVVVGRRRPVIIERTITYPRQVIIRRQPSRVFDFDDD